MKKYTTVIVETKLLEISEKIQYKDKTKTVFYCQSNQDRPRKCIIWRDMNIEKGGNVVMKGFIKDNNFVALWIRPTDVRNA